jgi:hypothetical protein
MSAWAAGALKARAQPMRTRTAKIGTGVRNLGQGEPGEETGAEAEGEMAEETTRRRSNRSAAWPAGE